MPNATIYTTAAEELTVKGTGKVVIENFWMGLSATFDFSRLPPAYHGAALHSLLLNKKSNP